MSDPTASSLILLGIGGAGCRIAAGISRAYGGNLRLLTLDTDASGASGVPFTLIGGNLLAGRGSGGSVPNARNAAKDDLGQLEQKLQGVKTAVIVTCLGGGTGGGVTLEVLQYLRQNGITSLVFATEPFGFEGEARSACARSVKGILEDNADVTVFLPLDTLVATSGTTDNMPESLQRGVDMVSTGVTLLWRLLEKPGFIRLDAERLRHLIEDGGNAGFATATATGPDRAAIVTGALKDSPLLRSSVQNRAVLVGVLAGDDLKLSEIGKISESVSFTFGAEARMELGTVNDEATFSGRLTVVILAIRGGKKSKAASKTASGKSRASLGTPSDRGRFNRAEPTLRNGVDLDIPTYLRQAITFDR